MTVIVIASVVALATLGAIAFISSARRTRLFDSPRVYRESAPDVVDRPVTEERRVERRSRPSRVARSRRLEDEDDYEEVETTTRRL
jgi:hypothetical protein